MKFLLAAVVAALLAFIEVRSRLASRPTWRGGASAWWVGRLGLEALIGALAAAAVELATDVQWPEDLPSWIPSGLAGGLGGPAFVRLTVATLGKGEEEKPVGLATFYEPVRNFFETALDDIGASEQTKWLHDRCLPALRQRNVPPDSVGDRLKTYVKALTRLSAAEKATELKFIEDTLNDTTATDDDKIEALLLRALALRAFRMIDSLVDQQP